MTLKGNRRAFCKNGMGIPGLPAADVGVKAEIEALKKGSQILIPIFRESQN